MSSRFLYAVVMKNDDDETVVLTRYKSKHLAEKRCNWLCNGEESAPFLVMELSEITNGRD
jgi:hypothetical protein